MSRMQFMDSAEIRSRFLRFFADRGHQVVPSASVEIGDRVRLVPRRLHLGGGAVQYFWKVTSADRG